MAILSAIPQKPSGNPFLLEHDKCNADSNADEIIRVCNCWVFTLISQHLFLLFSERVKHLAKDQDKNQVRLETPRSGSHIGR